MPSPEMLYCVASPVISEETLAHVRRREHLLGTWQTVPQPLCSQMGQGEEWYSAPLFQDRPGVPAGSK